MCSGQVLENNVTRVHFSTDGIDRIACIEQQMYSENTGFRALNAFDFGPYAVAMNMANEVRVVSCYVSARLYRDDL